MRPDIHIIVFSDRAEILAPFVEASSGLDGVSFFLGRGPEVTSREHLDALLLTLLEAERFGARRPYPIEKGFVLPMSPARVTAGLPRFVVAAAAMAEVRRIRDWRSELRLFLRAGIQAVRDFNVSAIPERISRIGLVADNLLPGKVDVEIALMELHDALGRDCSGKERQ